MNYQTLTSHRPTTGGAPSSASLMSRHCPLRADASAVTHIGHGTPSCLLSGVGVWEVGATWFETGDVSIPW